MYIISSAAFLYFNFILWALASLWLASELVYIYLASRPISIYVRFYALYLFSVG